MNTAANTNVSLLRLINSQRNRQIGRVAIYSTFPYVTLSLVSV
jgi:hypothetical protein